MWFQGETIRLKVTVKDESAALINPATTVVSITNPSGTSKVAAASMTNESTGVYYYDYTIPTTGVLGTWTYEVVASSGKPSIEQETFRVYEAL